MHGNRYDARHTDATWDATWSLVTRVEEDGWRAVAKIPFESINFEILKSNKLRLLLYRASFDDARQAEHSTWGGGRVHAADSFGEIVCDLE